MHGRLRARPGAVGARRHPARLQRQAARARHGRASSRSWRARSGASRRSRTRASAGSSTAPRRSRPTTSSSSASPTFAASGSPPGSRAHGIAGAGGVGRQLASWIVEGEPELDLWKMDIRRFGAAYRSQGYTLARSIENYATYYDIHYPNEERQAGRPLRTSPAYEDLAALGAVFGEKSGWERPNWFEPNATTRVRRRARSSAPPAWLGGRALVAGDRGGGPRDPPGRGAVRRDARSRRSRSSGAGATAFLQRRRERRRPTGRVDRLHADAPNRRGGIESDLTVTRLATDRFLLVTGTAFGNHDLAWLRQHRPTDGSVEVRDITSSLRVLRPVGPASARHPGAADPRRPLERRLPVPHRARDHRGVRAGLALRVTYVGELGWELYAATEYGRALWATLWEAAGARPRRRRVSRDRCAPAREGLSRLVERHHPRRDAVRGRARVRGRRSTRASTSSGATRSSPREAAGPRKRLRCLVLDDAAAVCLGNEPVRVDGEVVGRVTSGGYGFAVERSIAYAYLPPDQAHRHARRDRGLRRVGRLRGRARAAVRPRQREDPRMTDDAPPLRPPATAPNGQPRCGAGRTPSCGAGSRSPWRPATKPTSSPGSTSGATCRSRTKPDRTFVTQADTAIEGGSGRDWRPPFPTTASSARSSAPRPATPPSAGTSTRSTARTTTSGACRSSERCSRSSATESSRRP